MPGDKDWDDMTADEKADILRLQLDNVVDRTNRAFNRYRRRIAAIEAKLQKSHSDP